MLAQQCYILSYFPRDWNLYFNNHESARKNQPVYPARGDLPVVALRPPADGGIYGLAPRVQLYCSSEAGIQYNIPSRIVVIIANRLLGAPDVGYFGDFSFSRPPSIGKAPMGAFRQLISAVCITMRWEMHMRPN